ncbi:hypothetical protein [Subtercola endophyticus]|uniref:hypothetical protein n=1 Tax=Subtercola endophyticus TaxID=2895559 RepID=UPI001E33DAB5|nr:hypothetical protein [Subtercola endophyticus]UFS59510.1 hypothetical protein LQ955_01535 [Subtercola endophyticus]
MSASSKRVVELLPRIKPRVLTLGESFILALDKVPRGRGLTRAYEHIETVVGNLYGTRNTFGKLTSAESFGDLNTKDRTRAWILMATLGVNPAEFGANDDVPLENIDSLRRRLLLPELAPVREGEMPAEWSATARDANAGAVDAQPGG